MLDIYATLEIKQILDEISSYSKSEVSKKDILNMKMFSSINENRIALKEVDEMSSLILRRGNIPINVSFAIDKIIDTSKKGGILSPLDFEHIANEINNALNFLKYFARSENALYPTLNRISDKLIDLSFLEKEIHLVITPNLSISDNASVELYKIRQNIIKKDKDIHILTLSLLNKYKDYLSESTISIRNGHFVLPIKSGFKNKISGIIHDVSDSGQTTFVEPAALVELSNEIYLLHKEENEEIRRILKELSNKVTLNADALINNARIITKLDFVSAKAMYGNQHDCFVASLVDERIIDIKNARHPLIDKNKVVPNSFHLDENTRLIIISGPNAGGKTIALKTLGLMVMMNQMAIPLPTSSGATLSFFPRIYADIGDNQSLSDNLSTFAAHIANLSTITYFVTKNDLVLLDELGTGTSPNEGEAIAVAVSDFLLDKKCFGIISSHFEAMKEYAYRRDNVVNAMMVFDDKKLVPTYVLKVGFPGRSYGLEMAKRYHLDDNVIESAKKYLNKSKKRSVNDVLDKLNNVLRENENIQEDLKKREKNIISKEKDLSYQTKVLDKKKESLLSDVNETKEKMLSDADEKINKILRIINDPHLKQNDLIAAKKELKELHKELFKEDDEEIDDSIKINDYVETSIGLKGRVTSIKGEKIEVMTLDGMNLKTTLNKVTKINMPNSFSIAKIRKNNIDEMVSSKADVGLELNLIGEHVDEGIEKLSKYLDDARIKNFSSVRIIHGMGTGALRKAVHDYLKKCSFVKEYHYGGYYDGGSGATIVKLKDD